MRDISKISSTPMEYQAFLRFWANSYKYHYSNVVTMYGYDPQGTAFATLKQWNSAGRRVKAGKAGVGLFNVIKNAPFGKDLLVGELGGLDVYIHRNSMFNTNLYLRGLGQYPVEMSDSEVGTVTKLEDVLKGFESRIEAVQNSIAYCKRQGEEMADEINKPFPHMTELERLRRRKSEIDTALDLSKEKPPVPAVEKTKTMNM